MEKPVVLVVEDDFLIRLNAVDMVEQAGFTALEAENADEAIVILEARHDIALVFTDIQMPGSMDGLKLAAAVRDRWPPIKIIATSGQFKELGDALPSDGRFFPKPYQREQITSALQEMIGARDNV